MNTAEVLSELRGRGVALAPDGDRLRWKAPKGTMTPDLLARVREHKPELLRVLREADWDATDWRDWITERAAILEHDGGLSRTKAGRRAYEHALIEWQNRHPYHGVPDVCAGCGAAINESGTGWRPLADGAIVHYSGEWGLHCLDKHGTKRRAEAAAALAVFGINGGSYGG